MTVKTKPFARLLRAHNAGEKPAVASTTVSELADATMRRKALAAGESVATYIRSLIYRDLWPSGAPTAKDKPKDMP